MDAGRAPSGIFRLPPSCAELSGGSAPSLVAAPIDVAETQPPKQPESGTVPGNHGLRLDDD